MSWFSKNYEKAALGGAVAVAIGLSYLGWSKFSSIDENFGTVLTGDGNNNPAVASADLISKAEQSLKIDRTWTPGLDGEREVDLFTSIKLFIKSSDPEKPIDLLKDADVHEGMPNKWWLANRIDPGYGDSPERDPDQDGFSNKDEFLGETDPNNDKSHPSFIAKLMYVKDESLAWVVRPGFGNEGKFSFNYEDNKNGKNRVSPAEMVGPNETFFTNEPMKGRFKLLGHEVRKEVNKSTNVEMEVTMVRIEDQRFNKKGVIYEMPSPLSDDQRKNRYVQYDRTAVLSLEAGGMNGKEFKVEENTPFGLPFDSAKKDYLLKKVTPDSISVEYTDATGARKTVDINKGSLPVIPK